MEETKVLRVVGLSSAVLFDTKDPLNPINRRISIIVMNKKTEDSITQENRMADVTSKDDVKQAIETVADLPEVKSPDVTSTRTAR